MHIYLKVLLLAIVDISKPHYLLNTCALLENPVYTHQCAAAVRHASVSPAVVPRQVDTVQFSGNAALGTGTPTPLFCFLLMSCSCLLMLRHTSQLSVVVPLPLPLHLQTSAPATMRSFSAAWLRVNA